FGSIILIAGLLAIAKFTAYTLALTSVGILLAYRSDWPRKLIQPKDRNLGLATLAALPVAFLLHNPSLRGLFNYIYGSVQLSSGYNEAMSIPAAAPDLFYAIILTAMFVFGVVYAGLRRALDWRVALILLFLYWLNFKHGFVRA